MNKASLAAMVLLSAVATTARAQTRFPLAVTSDGDVERFRPSTDPSAIGVEDSAQVLGKWSWSAGLVLQYSHAVVTACVPSTDGKSCTFLGDALASRLSADLFGELGLGPLDLHMLVPVILDQTTDFATTSGSGGFAAQGFGNLVLGAKVRLLENEYWRLAVDASFTLPGSTGSFLADSGLKGEPRFIANWRYDKLSFGADVGLRFRQDAAHIGNVYVRDEFTWGLAAQVQILPPLSAAISLYGADALGSDPDVPDSSSGSGSRAGEIMFSGRYTLRHDWSIEAGTGFGLAEGVGTPNIRVFAGLGYAHTPAPPRPPAGDRDHDGVPDDVDKCPDEYGRTPDGCPAGDRDGDGLPDDVDRCPDVYARTPDGCPLPDRDGDGVPDAVDKCPDVPAQTPDGCPAPVVERAPDPIPEAPPPPEKLVKVTEQKIEITETVYFDTNLATIQARSFELLNQVADALKGSTIRVRVEGHTDDRGPVAYNVKLSKDRAESVKAYLVSKGIDAARLETEGYGPHRPVDHSGTEKARAANRRVEFVIINGGTP